jgi:hypothetical protein
MRQIYTRLFIGSQEDCFAGAGGWCVVHACRHPCYTWAASHTAQSTPTNTENDLYLDLIDPPVPLFEPAPFLDFLAFADRHWKEGASLLVHCNCGLSRAPSLALLFLAKRREAIAAESYAAARSAFEKLLPAYAPGEGIRRFLTDRWMEL